MKTDVNRAIFVQENSSSDFCSTTLLLKIMYKSLLNVCLAHFHICFNLYIPIYNKYIIVIMLKKYRHIDKFYLRYLVIYNLFVCFGLHLDVVYQLIYMVYIYMHIMVSS